MGRGRRRGGFYAVRTGRNPGVYHTWDECKAQVNGFSGARFKKFDSLELAQKFVDGHDRPPFTYALSSSASSPAAPQPQSVHASSSSSYSPHSTARLSAHRHSPYLRAPAVHVRAPHPPPQQPEVKASASASSSPHLPLAPPILPIRSAASSAAASARAHCSGRYTMHADGASKGNPGPAGAGAVIKDEYGTVKATVLFSMSSATNNEAEYCALLQGLKEAVKLGVKELAVFMDSKLVVEQMNGNWQVKACNMQTYHREAQEYASQIPKFSITHVYRHNNKEADRLANLAVDTWHR